MKVSYDEDLANHIGSESCVYNRKEVREALTGESAGWVLSRESTYFVPRSADAVENVGRQDWRWRHRKAWSGSARSETPSTYGNSLRRNWEIPCLTSSEDGGEARTDNPFGVLQ